MADETHMTGQQSASTPPLPAREQPAPPRPPARGRRTATAVGAVLLVLVLLIAVAVLLGRGILGSADTAAQGQESAVAQTAQAGAAAPAVTQTPPAEPVEVPLTDVFTFRDIFEPVVKPASTTQGGSGEGSETTQTGGSEETSETPSASENTLLLQDITVTDGVPTAVLVWNGTTYSAAEGDQVDDSPWKVLEIQDSTVVMLYGDTQVVLSVGQAVSK